MKNPLLLKIGLALILLLFLTQKPANAQVMTHEFGIRASGLNNFNFMYKRQKGNAETYKRYRAGFTAINIYHVDGYSAGDLGIGMAMGWEKRIGLSDKFEFIHGFEPRFNLLMSNGYRFYYDEENLGFLWFGQSTWANYNGLNPYSYADKVRRRTYSLGIGYILGLQYKILPNCFLGIELIPVIFASHSILKGKEIELPEGVVVNETRLGAGFSMNAVGLFFVYRLSNYKR